MVIFLSTTVDNFGLTNEDSLKRESNLKSFHAKHSRGEEHGTTLKVSAKRRRNSCSLSNGYQQPMQALLKVFCVCEQMIEKNISAIKHSQCGRGASNNVK